MNETVLSQVGKFSLIETIKKTFMVCLHGILRKEKQRHREVEII